MVATDRRTSGTQLEDQNMAFKAQHQISQKLGETARVNAMAYGGILLLTGDVPTDEAKNQATAMARGVENVKQVVNQLTVGPIASLGVRSNDTWLTSKVKTALINTKYVPSGTIAVTTDHSVVYLMGKLTQAEGDYAANAAADVAAWPRLLNCSRPSAARKPCGCPAAAPSPRSPAPPPTPRRRSSSAGAQGDGNASGGGSSGVQAIPIK